jgi:hypothetical protein
MPPRCSVLFLRSLVKGRSLGEQAVEAGTPEQPAAGDDGTDASGVRD